HRAFVQHMPNMGVLMFDTEMRYTLAEGPFLERACPDLKSLIGKKPQETALSADSINFIVPIYERALRGEAFNYERVTGSVAYEAYVTPLRDGAGRIVGGMTVNHDITERKKTEKALREREELHRLFTQHLLNTSVIMFDTDMRFTLAEGDFLRRIGLVSENMIGKLPHEVLSGETLNFMSPIYERVLKDEDFSYARNTPRYAYTAYATPLKNA